MKYDICSAFSLKNRESILSGDEQQIKTKLDLFGFVEIPKNKYNLSTIKLKQKEKLTSKMKVDNKEDSDGLENVYIKKGKSNQLFTNSGYNC
ncbi:unnamed protein product [marine sediment metagenome]|uniref:Uncharacterized protein n=1 Tax=marine sediment metagenome TaxID=412755 RepID=X1E2S0_9ZZZZ